MRRWRGLMLRGLMLAVLVLLERQAAHGQEMKAIDESEVLVPEGEDEEVVAGWRDRKADLDGMMKEWVADNGGTWGNGESPVAWGKVYPSGELILYDSQTGFEIRLLTGVSNLGATLRLSPDGRLVALQTHDPFGANLVQLWDAASSREIYRHDAAGAMLGLAFSPDSRLLAVGGWDRSTRIWDVVEGNEVRRLPSPDKSDAVAFSWDGRQLAFSSRDKTVRIWEVATWAEQRFIQSQSWGIAHDIAFSPDGHWMASGVAQSGEDKARVYDASSGITVAELPNNNRVAAALAFSPDGRYLAVDAGASGVKIWETASWRQVTTLVGHKDRISGLAFSPDSHYLASGSSDKTVRLWQVETWRLVRTLSGYQSAIMAVAFTPDGRYLASSAGDDGIRLWDFSVGKLVWEMNIYTNDVVFSPNSRYLASSSKDGTVWLWDWHQGKALARLFAGHGGWAFQRIGQRVYRHDDGQVFCRATQDTKDRCTPILPPKPDASPALIASARVDQIAGEGGDVGRIQIQVHNAGAGPAYWLRLAGRDLPRGVVLLPPRMPVRLDPGASVILPLEISSLSADPPCPRDLTLKLVLRHAHGDGPVLSVPLHLRAPRLTLSKSSVQGDRRAASVQVVLRNDGDQDPGTLQVTARFLRDGKPYGAPVKNEVRSLAPGEEKITVFPVPQELLALRDFWRRFTLEVTTSGEIWPTHKWVAGTPPLRSALFFYVLFGVALAIALALPLGLMALRFVRIYHDPVVLTLSASPASLTRFNLEELPRVDRALRRAHRLEASLVSASLTVARWERALAAVTDSVATASAFADALGARLGPQIAGHQAWQIDLPPLQVRFAHKSVVVVWTGKSLEAGDATQLAMAIHDEGRGPTVALLLDRTETQQAADAVRGAPHVSFVILRGDALRNLLLAPHPAATLESALACQRPVVELSPYQTGGGVDDERLFFGREAELRAMADHRLQNVLLVGPRQMGKSSLLKAVLRRVSTRPDVEPYFLTLSSVDLGGAVADKLGLQAPATPQAFREQARGTKERPRLWLIDEADDFVVTDAMGGYPLGRAMRALAEEGLAFFVLAGFWQLYAAVALDPHSPLRNFGKTVHLGPLGRDAARALAVQPMSALRLFYDEPATVDRMLDETGCRANLVAVACTGLIETLSVYDRTLTATHLDTVLRTYPRLRHELRYWRGSEVIDRVMVRAALMLGRDGGVTAGQVQRHLQERGVAISGEALSASLDRLEVGYLLVRDEQGRLSCPVPLLQRLIERDGDLAQELEDLRDQGGTRRPAGAD